MEENQDTDEPLMPSNPIEEKDMKIALLESEIEKAKYKDLEIIKLKEDLTKTNAKLKTVKNNFDLTQKKINFTRNATDLLVENISSYSGYLLVSILLH